VARHHPVGRRDHGTGIAETVLSNGVRVLTERMEGVRSVSTGVWVRHGSAHDSDERAGVSHFLEHMLFKGTRRRTARELAVALEGVGGSLDAYTSREHTSYQARILDRHLPLALDVLSDLTLHPLLRDEDLALEREVILEEIAQVEDTPDDLVFELHGARVWQGHPYGRSILGSERTVASMTTDALRALHAEAYRGDNLILAAAGRVDHDAFVRLARDHFGGVEAGEGPPRLAEAPGGLFRDERVRRDSAQSHVVFGTLLPGRGDPDRYALVLLSTALGGGMSSRLFQLIREELGLCYSVFTYQSFYSGGGVGGVYVGTRPPTEERCVEAVLKELATVAADGLPGGELEQVKQQVKGQILLSLESTASRLYRLTGFALHDEPFLGVDEVLSRLDAATVDDVARLADLYFHPRRQLVLRLGPV
jgi:predicted Zn-dependent peptidase